MSRGILFSPLDLNEPTDPHDRFAYGWRYVKTTSKDGSETMVQIPLTLEDVLHPQEEDFQVLSDPHTKDTIYLRGAFEMALADSPGAVVLSDCRVAWDREGEFGHGPDCAVIFNVRKIERWSTFNVVEEQTKPALIVEVTSPSTRSTDLVNKVREYAEQGVPHYVIADARDKEEGRRISLIDYYLAEGEHWYYSLPLSADGRIWLPEVNLWLGIEDGKLVCDDSNGRRVGTIVEEHQARLEAEEARMQAEVARLEAEEARMQAEVARLEAEEARMQAEKLAEDERKSRAESEEQAAKERAMFEAHIKKLEERLRQAPVPKNGRDEKTEK